MFKQDRKRLDRVISVRQDSLAVKQQTSQLVIVAAVTTIGKMFRNLLAYQTQHRHYRRTGVTLISSSSFSLLIRLNVSGTAKQLLQVVLWTKL
jgi:hypothetical protein